MTDAYRDDLEAALARASDLEREVEALRKRVAELESGDRQTIEARENARRLEAALEREREELHQRFENHVDAEIARRQVERQRRAPRQPLPWKLRLILVLVYLGLGTLMGLARFGSRGHW